MTLIGKVLKKQVAKGSKSEHNAVILVTNDREFNLRRLGGNAFQDDILDSLIDQEITAHGTIHNYTFIMNNWTIN